MGEPNHQIVTIDDQPQIERTSSNASVNSGTDLLHQVDVEHVRPEQESKQQSNVESRPITTVPTQSIPTTIPTQSRTLDTADNFWTSVSCWLIAGITFNSIYRVYGAIFCAFYILLCIMVILKIKSGYIPRQN